MRLLKQKLVSKLCICLLVCCAFSVIENVNEWGFSQNVVNAMETFEVMDVDQFFKIPLVEPNENFTKLGNEYSEYKNRSNILEELKKNEKITEFSDLGKLVKDLYGLVKVGEDGGYSGNVGKFLNEYLKKYNEAA